MAWQSQRLLIPSPSALYTQLVIPASAELIPTKYTFVYGVAKGGSEVASGTQYETGVGWVGITTYNDTDGNLRVKKEILVAMSGISTGNVPAFPGQK